MGAGFGIAFKILDDPDGLDPVLPGKSILQLKNVIFLADADIPLDIVFRDLVAAGEVDQQFLDLIVDPAQVVADMIDEQQQRLLA